MRGFRDAPPPKPESCIPPVRRYSPSLRSIPHVPSERTSHAIRNAPRRVGGRGPDRLRLRLSPFFSREGPQRAVDAGRTVDSRSSFDARGSREAHDPRGPVDVLGSRRAVHPRRGLQAADEAKPAAPADKTPIKADVSKIKFTATPCRALRLRRRRVARVLSHERPGRGRGHRPRGRRLRDRDQRGVQRGQGREREIQAEGGRNAGRRRDAAQERGTRRTIPSRRP